MKYRKKPVEIEAVLWTGENIDEVLAFGVPAKFGVDLNCPYDLYIETIEGTMHASDGDYIIRGLRGEYYPCKPDIFVKSYEAVEIPTNFDRITASPEALAKAFANGCPREDWHCKGRSCERCWFDYLNSPAESEEV